MSPLGALVPPAARRWLRLHRHETPLRQTLSLAERAYQIARRLDRAADRPAVAGGWPVRLVPLSAPRPFGRSERRELARVLRAQNTSYSDGDAVRRFELALAERWGCRHAIAVSSGTAALHSALIAAGVGPGDEVVVPALTYVSTALAVLYQGASPRFVDAEPACWNLDPSAIEAAVTPRTKAILLVHLCGVPCDLDAIRAIAERRRLTLIEDAAQAHGSTYGGRAVGTFGRLGCLSFQSAKSLTTGEGGAVLTDDDELARRARLAMNLGESTGRGRPTADGADVAPEAALDYALLGWNYRMSALQAALGLGQLARFDEHCRARIRHAEFLRERLTGVEGIRLQGQPLAAAPVRSSFFLELADDGQNPPRDELARALARERIDFRLPYQRPLPAHAIFGQGGSFPVAERICARAIGFRVDPLFGRAELGAIASALRRALAWQRAQAAPRASI